MFTSTVIFTSSMSTITCVEATVLGVIAVICLILWGARSSQGSHTDQVAGAHEPTPPLGNYRGVLKLITPG